MPLAFSKWTVTLTIVKSKGAILTMAKKGNSYSFLFLTIIIRGQLRKYRAGTFTSLLLNLVERSLYLNLKIYSVYHNLF